MWVFLFVCFLFFLKWLSTLCFPSTGCLSQGIIFLTFAQFLFLWRQRLQIVFVDEKEGKAHFGICPQGDFPDGSCVTCACFRCPSGPRVTFG